MRATSKYPDNNPRTSSASRPSDHDVNPTKSTNTTDTHRNSPPDTEAEVGRGSAATEPADAGESAAADRGALWCWAA
ncbi:MAG: hypothetical protein WKF82_12870 [Nocardioidaceae bacterium]